MPVAAHHASGGHGYGLQPAGKQFVQPAYKCLAQQKLLGYAYPQQIRDILPALLLSLGMGGAVYAVELLGLGSWPTLLIQVPLGVLLYVLGSKLCRLESYEYLLAAIKSMTGKGRK